MVEFINRLTESQASERVRKVLRADPDKKREQPDQQENDGDKKESEEQPQDEVILKSEEEVKPVSKSPQTKQVNDEEKVAETNADEIDANDKDGHIDVTA